MKKCFLLMIPLLMACNDGTDKTAALTVEAGRDRNATKKTRIFIHRQ